MTKKTAKKKVSKKTASKGSASTVEKVGDYSREIWLAGLGAFSMAQDEGRKVVDEGGKLFDRLVKEGSRLEGKGRKAASDTVGGLKDDVESRVDKVRKSAQTNWDKLEKVFEQRVARALSRLGVPTSEEIKSLSRQVEQLNKRVAELSAKQNAAPAATAKSTSAKAN